MTGAMTTSFIARNCTDVERDPDNTPGHFVHSTITRAKHAGSSCDASGSGAEVFYRTAQRTLEP
jgi:hypothetical protein